MYIHSKNEKILKVLNGLKKWIVPTIMVFSIFLILSYKWYTHPRQIVQNIEAVEFQLGKNAEQTIMPVRIEIDGHLIRSITGAKHFDGSIQLFSDDKRLTDEKSYTQIVFNLSGGGVLVYDETANGVPKLNSYGLIFIDKDFSSVTIAKHVTENGETNTKSWEATRGMMIAGPASSREEGLRVSNTLMADFLKVVTLD